MDKSDNNKQRNYWHQVNEKRKKNRRKKKIRSSVIFLALIFLAILTGKNIINSFASKGVEQPKKKTEIEVEKPNPKENIKEVEIEEIDEKTEEKVEEIEEEAEKEKTEEVKIEEEKPLPEVLKDDLALEASEAVPLDYFDDAVFLGNSRTETFVLYTGLSNATSYAFKGFSVTKVLEEPAVNINGQKLKILEALKHQDFSKVYMMFGYNETGWVYPELFIEKYEKIIDGVREANPDAIIYVQSIIPVSQKASESNGDENNERIDEYNGLIKEMVKRKDVHYLNVAESVVDETGVLPEEAAFDGVHLKKEWAEKWLEYLKTHTLKD